MYNCFYHSSQQAVAQCQRCGKSLCRSCSRTYAFNPSDWHGKTLCPNCTRDILKEERAEMESCRSDHIGRIVGTAIGMVIGLVAGILIGKNAGYTALYAVLLTFIGGAIVGSIKAVLSCLGTVFKSVIVGTIGGYLSDNPVVGLLLALPVFIWAVIKAMALVLVEIVKSIYHTIRSIIWVVGYSKSVKQYDDSLAELGG